MFRVLKCIMYVRIFFILGFRGVELKRDIKFSVLRCIPLGVFGKLPELAELITYHCLSL